MAKLKHYEKVLALGRLLVKELELEQSVDTLGRWMAHHISELIIMAEEAKGSHKPDIEDRCREAILALWAHISVFPRGHRPLENIEVLLATIQAIDPDNQAYFYQSEAQTQIKKSTLSDKAKDLLDLSIGIDHSARLLIGACLKYAANEINEKKRDLLELVRTLDADTPQTFALRFISNEQEKSDEEKKVEDIQEAIKTLKNRRERLRIMVEKSTHLAWLIDGDIKKLEQSIDK